MQTLDKELQKQVRRVSKRLGVPEMEVIERAVSSYLGSLEDLVSLRGEMRMWDILSARTIRKHNF